MRLGRHGAASSIRKQTSEKSLQTISLCNSNAKSTLLVLPNFIKFEKTKHENFNFAYSLQTTSLCNSNAKSTLLLLPNFIKFEKTKHENFISVHFSSFLPIHNLKTMQYMRILYVPNDCSTVLVWGRVRAMTGELWS